MTSIATKPAEEPRQVRFESIFITDASGDELEILQNELVSFICSKIDEGLGREHVITSYQFMDDVSQEESDRLQQLYAEAVGEGGLEEAAGDAIPVTTTPAAGRRPATTRRRATARR